MPAGLTEFDVRIASIDDEVYEVPENFTVDVTGLSPVQGTETGTATIVDDGTGPGPDPDDDRPGVTISDAGVINEGDTANFVVTLANVSEDDVQVELSLNLGDTEAGDLGTLEYNTGSGWVVVPVDGVVTVPAGLTEFDVRIASIDDEVYEVPENFTVDVTGLDLFKALIRVPQPLSMTVLVLIPIQMTTAQRFLLATLARLTKVTPPISLYL
ncbi:Calx-beta domain-containing protein [Vibrio harveyi]|nr:Calx-beta domain-containing protein [Vibrio harveyi]